MRLARISLYWLVRTLKKGDWLWLWLAVMMASLTVTLVTQLSATVKESMLRQAAISLGADAVIRSTRPIDTLWQQKAQALGLETSRSVSLMTMMQTEGDFRLIQLKAVDDAFPLRGEKIFWPNDAQNNQAWLRLEQKLLPKGNSVKDLKIQLGQQTFRGLEAYQPNVLEGMNAIAPEVMIRLSDLAATQLLGPGSRVNYQLAVKAPDGKSQALDLWLQAVRAESNPAWQLLAANAPTEDLQQALTTADLFLQLSALSAVLVAGLAILIASRYYLSAWQNQIGLLRAFGATQKQIRGIFAWQLSLLGLMASGLGALLGWLGFIGLTPWLADYFEELLVPFTGGKLLFGLLAGSLVLWAFSWPAYRQVVQLAPMKILRSVPHPDSLMDFMLGVFGLSLLIWSLIGWEKWLWILLGLGLVGLVFYLAAKLLLLGLRLSQKWAKGWLKIALSSVTRNAGLFQLQVIAFGLVLFVLMSMTLVRQDLLSQWQLSLGEEAPNSFVMNIQPDQKNQTLEILSSFHLSPELIAMARGRLVALNDRPLIAEQQASNRARRLLEREANIALMPELPGYNRLVSGSEGAFNQGVSIEKGIAELYGIQLGDRLTFDFLGQKLDFKVTSIREVVWQSFRLNFFFILPQSYQSQLTFSYIGNFHLAEQGQALNQALTEAVPGVLLIEVKAIIGQLQQIINQASWAVSALYLFSLLASVLVLLTAILAGQQDRVQTWLLLKTLGLEQVTLIKMGLTEFVLLGALAGFLAASFAQLASGLLGVYFFQLSWQWQPSLWVWSLLNGIASLLLLAWVTQKPYVRLSPMQLKRALNRF